MRELVLKETRNEALTINTAVLLEECAMTGKRSLLRSSLAHWAYILDISVRVASARQVRCIMFSRLPGNTTSSGARQ